MRLISTLALGAFVLPVAAHATDPHSYARPQDVAITHLDLDLAVDFAQRRIAGTATLSLDWKNPDASDLVLDTSALAIQSVAAVDGDRDEPLTFQLAAPIAGMGSKLTIAASAHPRTVRIAYATSPDASGLQWLDAAQTADRRLPFLFSQSEATHARSWIPLQDSPMVRFTYNARVTAPKDVRIVMSAPNDARHPLDGSFAFKQVRPIPSYLMAIAGGDLAVHETGPRSAVYAEPSVVKKAAREFEDTERMLEATEKLYGPYRWGRYDLLVLPPSFPYGGMENPNMTFATPTVLVGDKSLVSLVAHELAHSWSGNLVTNATWRDGWLNEGFTTYVQGRITEALYGTRQANEEALLAIRNLQKTIGRMPENAQRLAPEPRAIDADDELSDVIYDKGSWFLRTLEARFGRADFDAWIAGYFDHFAWRSVTTEEALAYLRTNLIDKYPGRMTWDEVETWVYGPGIPSDAPMPDSPRFDAIDEERAAFLAGNLAADKLDAHDWNTQEWMYFLDRLPDTPPLARMQELDTAWHLTGTPNAEIGMRWYIRAIAAGNQAAWPAAAAHATRIGRLYLTMPIYKALVATPAGFAYAQTLYAKAKGGYHPLTRMAVERLFAKTRAAGIRPGVAATQG